MICSNQDRGARYNPLNPKVITPQLTRSEGTGVRKPICGVPCIQGVVRRHPVIGWKPYLRACMVYKPEHIVDLESGAIIAAELRPGDAGDTGDLSGRLMDAVAPVEEIYGRDHVEGNTRVKDITGDKGFHHPRALGIIQEATGVGTIIGDPNAERRQPANPEPEARRAVAKAARAVKSKSGKALLKKRGGQIRRGCAHVPDCGGLRCTSLQGRINNNKHYLCGILAFNLSLIMRKLTGRGTPRQAAAARAAFWACYDALRWLVAEIPSVLTPEISGPDSNPARLRRRLISGYTWESALFSTGS